MRLQRRAAIIALSYFVFGVTWIFFSDYLVELVSHSLKEFRSYELIKGVGFVLVTAIGLFWFSSSQIKKVVGDAFNLIQNRTLLFSYERKSLAGLFSLSVADELRKISTESPAQGISELLAKLDVVAKTSLSEGVREVNLTSMIRSSADIAKGYSPLVRGCDIRLKMAESIDAKVFAGLFHQMLVNLLLNASEAVKGNGTIEVHCERGSGGIILEVHDSGPGIPAAQWKSVLDPFYSSKRDGMGFGLLAVQACAAAHRGKVRISASHLGGARVDIDLPQ